MAQVVEHILGKDEVTGSSPVSSSNKKVSFVFLTKETFLSDAFLAERDAHCVRDAALPVMHAFGECQNASHHPSQHSGITYHFLQRDYFVILFEKVPDV